MIPLLYWRMRNEGRASSTLIPRAHILMLSSIFYGPASPLTPSSSLRVALSTSLLTTQTQCDNVRQLLSAITSPTELAQLAEMYAPPSPVKSTFSPSSDSRRPLSHPGPSPHATPMTDRARKRSTWNGSYVSLALAGSPPPFQLAQRREKRRSDLSSLLGTTSPSPARTRLRNVLSSPPQPLADVSEGEEEEGMVTADSSPVEDEEDDSFGAAALGLYRNRVSGGLRALELPQRSAPLSLTRGHSTKRRTTMSPGSKYTSMHTTRHPFSLSSLRHSLQNALASKRFACSHLLALRFEDDEDEVYWEDVRSVMSLLTSTLVDASSRLSEVLDDVEEQHLKAVTVVDDDTPASESVSGLNTPSSLASPPPARTRLPLSHAVEQIVSFAPTPSQLARFASHVDAISSALDDAREHLEQCVASLKDERTMAHSPGHSSHPSTSSCGDGGVGESSEHPAIQAYERLRREIGLALRECERGREGLVHLVTPRTPLTDDDPDPSDPSDPSIPAGTQKATHVEDASSADADTNTHEDSDSDSDSADPDLDPPDDATAHLPPPGIEQVFEAESGAGSVGAFTRERSTLSREERIRAIRDVPPDRDRGPSSRPSAGGWGPSGEVVRELKDVIWKVGQRRRQLTESL